MLHQATHPIGIFDSGLGGLTVAKTIANLMPNESLVYFGDTAHTPWGEKSAAAIQVYSIKICELLLKHHCKMIVMACHTASTVAFELVKEYVGDRAHVINVVEPVVQYIHQHHDSQKIGLIGTKQTVRSNTYKQRLEQLNKNLELSALATPLLVPLIEEGFLEKPASKLIIDDYLSHPALQGIHALILGCTHYPLLKQHFENFYHGQKTLIDASDVTAEYSKALLAQHQLLNRDTSSKKIFYVSDYNDFFVEAARKFFSQDIQLEAYPLWD